MTDYSQFKILVDLPSKSPALGFQDTAHGLASLIRDSEPQFAIAIFGPWGSGKTTLMDEIKRQLNDRTTISVDFSAWRYEKEQHLIIPLLDTIRAALVDWSERIMDQSDVPSASRKPTSQLKKIGKAAMGTAQTVGKVMASVLAGLSFKIGIPGALDLAYDANKSLSSARDYGQAESNESDENDKTDTTFSKRLSDPTLPQSFYHACFSALSDAFKQFEEETGGTRIVVFVDDLDRCLPTGTLEVLESMKLFFDLRGFVFVVGLDRDVVEPCIDSRYLLDRGTANSAGADENVAPRQLIRGADYLKKIFQVPFSLAPVSLGLLDELFQSLQQDSGLSVEQVDDLNAKVRPHLAFLFSSMRLNPREVKRFINAYTIQMKVKPGLQADHVLALNTIAFRTDCETLYYAIATYRVEFTTALKAFLVDEPTSLDEFDVKPSDIPDDIRDYFRPGGPAQPLLDAPDLDLYLDAGEATRSSSGGYFLDVLRNYREYRSTINKAVEAADASELDSYWSSASKAFEQLEGMLMSVNEGIAGSPRMQAVRDWLHSPSGNSSRVQLENALRVTDTGDNTDNREDQIARQREAFKQECQDHSDLVLAEIRQTRRRESLSA